MESPRLNRGPKGLGRNQRRLVLFATDHPGWHSYARDQLTARTVRTLQSRGLIEVSPISRQFRLAKEAEQ